MTSRTGGSGGDDVDILCLGGADLSLLLGTLTTATSTGSADVTTTGIDPDAVLLCLGNTSSTTIASDGTASGFAVGASDGTTHGGYALVDEDAADTTNTESSYSSANAVYSRTSASGTASDLVVGAVSMGTGKFSVNYTTVSGTARKGWFLAFGPAAATGVSGVLSSTLGTLTSSATGALAIAGTTTQTLGNLISSATGTLALSGSLTQALGDLTSASTGTVAIVGALTAELGALTVEATGAGAAAPVSADLTQTLGELTSTATGTVAITGTAAQTLGALTIEASGSGQIVTVGTMTAELGALTAEAAGTLPITGTTSATLGALTSSATGRVDIAATLGITLGDLTLSAQMLPNRSGELAATLGALTLAATGVSGAVSDFVDGNPRVWLLDARRHYTAVDARNRVAHLS